VLARAPIYVYIYIRMTPADFCRRDADGAHSSSPGRSWRRRRGIRPLAAALVFAAALPAFGQVQVKVSDSVFFRLGFAAQAWADWTQDPVSDGYSQNQFLRRVRFIAAGQVAPDVTFFFQTDDQRLGNATPTAAKNLTTGFVVQDAFGEWRIAGDRLMLDAGLAYVPQSRNVLTGSMATMSLDGGNFVQQQTASTQSNGGRDLGFQLKGYLAGDHLEYRAGVFTGQRLTGSRNSPRFAARAQYDFFDAEKGYTYVGTNRGSKKILAVGAWGDAEGNYRAYGADAMLDLPVGKDAVTVETDWIKYDGGKQFTQVVGGVVTPLLPSEDGLFAHAGYYFDAWKVQPFVRFERLHFQDDAFRGRDERRYAVGWNWYASAQNFKITGFYERIIPHTAVNPTALKETNQFVVQLQFYYF